jgi:hypothetical protein
MGCRCRLHRRHDRPPIRLGLTGDGHEVVHPEDGSDATGREHVLGEPVADRSISASYVERRRKGCVQGELGGVGVGCRRRRSSGHGSIVGRWRDHNPGEETATLDSRSGGRFTLGVRSFPTTPAGYHALSGWLGSFGRVDRVGVEGTGTYGAGLARHLAASGITVIEVDRPNRQQRRRNGKSDELDAIAERIPGARLVLLPGVDQHP